MNHSSQKPFAQRLRARLEEALAHGQDDQPEGLLEAMRATIDWALTKKSGHPLRRIAQLGVIVRESRRAVWRQPVDTRDTLALILLTATFNHPDWAPYWPNVWDPPLRGTLAGSYQFSLRLAENALALVEGLRTKPDLPSEAEQETLLTIARAALEHGTHGFVQAGPKVHGVRLSPRFAARVRNQLYRLADLSGNEQHSQCASRFQARMKTLLGEDATTRAQRQAERPVGYAPEALQEARRRAQPLFALSRRSERTRVFN